MGWGRVGITFRLSAINIMILPSYEAFFLYVNLRPKVQDYNKYFLLAHLETTYEGEKVELF